MRYILGIALTCALCAFAVADEKADEAAKKLEGTYTMTEFLLDGKPNAKADKVKSVEIKDGVISVNDGDKVEDAKFKLNPSKTPMEIDLTLKGGNSTVLGICQTKETDKGLELTIAFIHGGDDGNGKRPKDFKGEGKDVVVMKLLRKK
ncbi:hypothetical protein [Frigoriglobus tundricola]|uniref:TIGR03067 domain-containing protein n=1 Tax=Frigoriglobus tundricola TaxID=2774151 RepID=A0A6M5Z1R8_9BACT|nr:hypothetical protein [Frigoriglobus tundricola]QJX00320.1 hypothetical protein FTUN_7946 [Frigoriglobus tundricola]